MHRSLIIDQQLGRLNRHPLPPIFRDRIDHDHLILHLAHLAHLVQISHHRIATIIILLHLIEITRIIITRIIKTIQLQSTKMANIKR